MWKKLKFVSPSVGAVSHAQLPTPLILSDRVRVYFAGRDAMQRSSVYFTDIALDDEHVSVAGTSCAPLLSPGDIGTFDEHGVFPSSVVEVGGVFRMYFIGWNQGAEAPLFYASIGIAESVDGVNYVKRDDINPILARGPHDPCLVTSPDVYRDGDRWRMTYVSGVRWSRTAAGRLRSHYHVKSAQSDDGLIWQRGGNVAIDFQNGETNLARSSVLKVGDRDYRMWYCFVHPEIGKYRVGYAQSADGERWTRDDANAGIGLDDKHATEMICYPKVFQYSGQTYMLYNGDGFGRDGFGVAIFRD